MPPLIKYKAPPFEASLLSNRQRSNHTVVPIADVIETAPPNAASFETNDALMMSTSIGSASDMAPPSRTAVFSTKDISPATSNLRLKEEYMPPETQESLESVKKNARGHPNVGVRFVDKLFLWKINPPN